VFSQTCIYKIYDSISELSSHFEKAVTQSLPFQISKQMFSELGGDMIFLSIHKKHHSVGNFQVKRGTLLLSFSSN